MGKGEASMDEKQTPKRVRAKVTRRAPEAQRIKLTPKDVRETLFGIYTHCRKRRNTGQDPAHEDFASLVDEVCYNLTDVEKRRLLKFADGMSAEEIAEEEGCRREAVLCSKRNMIRKNDYCEISSRLGVLRPRINQYK